MSATAEQVKRLRRMVAESTTTTYTDADLRGYIERYPLVDGLGNEPTEPSETDPVTLVENDDWTATYDLNAAAADVWSEKAAALASEFDFQAGSQTFQRSQAHAQYMRQAGYYRARRSANTIRLQTIPKPELDLEANNSDYEY